MGFNSGFKGLMICTPHCMKISPVAAELFRVDGRTDMLKLMVTLRNFANSPKKGTFTLLPSMKTEGEVAV